MTRAPERIVHGDLVIRRWRRTDALAQATAVRESLDHLRPWMPWAATEPLPVEERRAMLARAERAWAAGDEYSYGLFLGRVVVGAGSLVRRIGPGGVEIGYWVHVDEIGHGLATLASRALTNAALAVDGITTVYIRCDERNTSSAAVPRRLGYELDETLSRAPEAPGESGRLMIWSRRQPIS